MARGRPLWFLGCVLAGWTGLRVTMLWQADVPLPTLDAEPVAAARVTSTPTAVTSIVPTAAHALRYMPPDNSLAANAMRARKSGDTAAETGGAQLTLPGGNVARRAERRLSTSQVLVVPLSSPFAQPAATTSSRLAVDAWLVLRPGGGDSLPFGQLGASQGGARLTYGLDDERRVALSGRVSAPLRGRGAELAVGIDVQPTGLPVHLLVEERFGLGGGGARPAAGLIAGGSAALPGRARLDAYGQGGAVWRRGGFVDGAAMVTRPLLGHDRMRVELGGGAWGAAQRRLARLDLGPSLAVVAPVGGRAIRLQLDYRARVAGRARPASGPALTVGGSF